MPSQNGLPQIYEARALRVLMDLLKIPGVSCEEGDVARFVVQQLRKSGVPASWITVDDVHQRSPRGGNSGNVICRFPGTLRGPRRQLSAHLDTVPLCREGRPVRKGDAIVSANPNAAIGADDRAGVAAVLNAALEIRRGKRPHPPLTFVFFVQEEIGLFGSRLLNPKLLGNPKLCFNWDGNQANRIQIGATGASKMQIIVHGLSSHAAQRPEKGISAVAIAGLAIADLQTNGWHGLVRKGRQNGTSNIGVLSVISAGEATNVVSDRVRIFAEARSHNPAFRQRIIDEYRKAFFRAAKKVRNDSGKTGEVEFQIIPQYDAYRLGEEDPSVATAKRAVEAMGLTPELFVSNAGVDGNWLTRHGLPTVTLGSGQTGAHTLASTVSIPDYLNGCRLALSLATAADR